LGGTGNTGFPGGYYPPAKPVEPPLSTDQQQLIYLYNHRDELAKLPPEQQKQVIKRAQELLKENPLGTYPSPTPAEPPLSAEQQQLIYLYNHRDELAKLPPEQQKQIIKRAQELLKKNQ
jgi:adenylate kinase